MRLQDLFEAPVNDYVLHGDFNEPSSFGYSDHRVVSSPRGEAKIRRRFGRTPYLFNLHFINQGGGEDYWHGDEGGYGVTGGPIHFEKPHTEHFDAGETNSAQLKQSFGVDIRPDPSAITFIMAGNDQSIGIEGSNDPVSAWIIAHRFVHTLEYSNSAIYQEISDLFLPLHPHVHFQSEHYRSILPERIFALEAIRATATMKSARDGNMLDVETELITQYIMAGQIRLHRADTINPKRGYYQETFVITNAEGFNRTIAEIETNVNAYSKALLDKAVGKIFII